MVKIHVGADHDSKIFSVHENLLTRHSEFFAAALNGEWIESKKSGTLPLPEHGSESFGIFNTFLYSGRIYSAKEGDYTESEDGGHTDQEWERLSDAWHLGQKLLATTLRDAVVDALAFKIASTSMYPVSLTWSVYEVSAASSAMRRLLVDIAVWLWDDNYLEKEQLRSEPLEFVLDLAAAMSKIRAHGRQSVSPLSNPGCRYHDHVAEGKPCYKTMF